MGLIKFVNYLLDMARRMVRKGVVFVEYIANFFEAFVWSVRNKIVFLALIALSIPFFSQIIKIEGVGLIIITFVVVDIIVTLINNFYKPNKRIIPLAERVFSLIPYIWIFIETTINYFDWGVYVLSDMLNTTFGVNNFYPVLVDFIERYTSIPGGQFIQTGLFFLFYYGIGRNKTIFPFFVRYNYVQAVLFVGISTFICHIFMLWAKIHSVPTEIGIVAVMIYSLSTLLFGFCMVSVILGRESKIPFLHQNILFHTGLREDDGRNPLGLNEYDK